MWIEVSRLTQTKRQRSHKRQPPLLKGVGTKLHKCNFYRLLRKLEPVEGFVYIKFDLTSFD